MAAIVANPPRIGQSSIKPPPLVTFHVNHPKVVPVPVPNKHLQALSPGVPPIQIPDTPPASPPNRPPVIQTSSLLYPPDSYDLFNGSPGIYSIDAHSLTAALKHAACQPLPEPQQVFPWLHGLHPQNNAQLSFFVARRRSIRKAPRCLRGIAVVKLGGDLSSSRIKGAIAPSELLCDESDANATFLEIDPADGFSVRNFQIQACKLAMVSDIVIYGDENAKDVDLLRLGKRFVSAQRIRRSQESLGYQGLPQFNTFILSTPFHEFEVSYPELVATDSAGRATGEVMDFFQRERTEMCEMSRASEIAKNIWLGPTPEELSDCKDTVRTSEKEYDLLIEASDLASIPDSDALGLIEDALRDTDEPQIMDFPSSGSIMPPDWSQMDVSGILHMCQWMQGLADPEGSDEHQHQCDKDGDMVMKTAPRPKRILIHCTDGYTETSLLALTYFMYVEGVPVHEAWLRLHCEKQRNFFAYPSDVSLLVHFQSAILQASSKRKEMLAGPDPLWLSRMDGSLPSRILPYMYLGNLGHAKNPGLLSALGIGQVLSVGEAVLWPAKLKEKWGCENLLRVDGVQDNGIDPLTDDFARCLDFLEKGKSKGTATLVHCRVGVSRSATICIAEVMKTLGMSFARAYCFVRARRLNVIIQPHLRFAYELLKWEEARQAQEGMPLQRELEWATIAREIALMNKPYSR